MRKSRKGTRKPDQQGQADLRAAIIKGCKEMAEVYLETERDYHPLEEEVANAQPEPKTD